MNNSTATSRLVLATAPLDDRWVTQLQHLSAELHIEKYPNASVEDVPDDLWKQVEVLFTGSTLPSPQQAPGLRWVQLYSAGANQVLESPLFKHSIPFTTASGVHAVNIGEYVFATILTWFHQVPHMLDWKQSRQWPPDPQRHALFLAEELYGKTLAIVGYGSIGRQVARVGKGFGMRIVAMERGSDHHDHGFQFPDVGDPAGELPDRYYPPDQLHAMLGESDVVVITIPLTPETKGMFDGAAFASMKHTALLVNIARGDVCDEAALIRALQERQIAGAALDVFHQEPLPSQSPLFDLPNVILSPHVAGFTREADERVAMIFVENMRRYLAGEALYNLVDPEKGY